MATFNVSVDDTLGLSDTGTSRTVTLTGADPAGTVDTVTPDLVLGPVTHVDDALGLTDGGSLTTRLIAGVELLGLTDSLRVNPDLTTVTITDLLGITDLDNPIRVDVDETVTDQAGPTDTATIVASYLRIIVDSAGLADAPSQSAPKLAVTDQAGLTDTVAVALTVAIDDTTGLTDSIIPVKVVVTAGRMTAASSGGALMTATSRAR